MDILEVSYKEDDKDPQHVFYYARELTFNRRWDEAKVVLTKYLGMEASNDQNERCYAMRILGKSYAETGDAVQAEKWFLQAAAESPNTREPWCELAMLMYQQNRWEECFSFSMRALRIVVKQLTYTADPSVWGHWAHDLASVSAWQLGLRDIALTQAKLALELSPEDVRLQGNLRYILDEMKPCIDGDTP
jgi:tetratricopeptide (TPR) repeat protein